MTTPRQALDAAFRRLIEDDPLLAPSKSPAHDVQANFALRMAKQAKTNPRELATRVLDQLGDADGLIADAEVAGPGFINVRFTDAALAGWATGAAGDERVGVPVPERTDTVVIDYSSPNVAKDMHVGHLRSTVIGDALVRVLEFCGDTVIRQNHIGDWGTQFGMLTQQMTEQDSGLVTDFEALGELYRAARKRYDEEPDFAQRARERVVALQSGDEQTLALWQRLVDVSMDRADELYRQLDVTLHPEHVKGESFYNPVLDQTVDELAAKGVAVDDQGALIVRSPRFTNKDGSPTVLIARKSDGGYGYAATDFATLRHSVDDLDATRLLYVTDARQAGHFEMVFDGSVAAGWLNDDVRAEHVPFGMVLGEDRKPFKTRDGEVVALAGLLDEAVRRSKAIVDERSPELPEAERAAIAQAVGIGAVKYADLSNSRQRDYVFSFDRMLALTGNTSVYLQYAHARTRKLLADAQAAAGPVCTPLEAAERDLILGLAGFGDAVTAVAHDLTPHVLCGYLFDLSGLLAAFYRDCPVLKASTPEIGASRLTLCALTAATLQLGLGLLGIAAPGRM